MPQPKLNRIPPPRMGTCAFCRKRAPMGDLTRGGDFRLYHPEHLPENLPEDAKPPEPAKRTVPQPGSGPVGIGPKKVPGSGRKSSIERLPGESDEDYRKRRRRERRRLRKEREQGKG